MKVSTLVSLVLAATFVFAGCDRKSPQAEPSKYDANLDGPPMTVAVYVDPLLLADQTKISGGFSDSSGSSGSSAPPPVAAPTPTPKPDVVTAPPPTEVAPAETVTEIKAAIDGFAAAVKDTDNLDKLSDFIADDQDVRVARTLLQKAAALVKKSEALRQLVQDKLGTELPPVDGPPVQLPGSQLQAGKENLKFLSSDDVALATGPMGMKTTFVKADNRWKIRYSAMDRKMLVISAKLLEAFEGAMAEMTSGIEDGTVTKDNFEAKTAATAKEKIGPIMAELMQLMMPMMGEIMGGAPDAPTRKPTPDVPGWR